MKLLTITVPCYNSQDYLDRCMESLLVGGEDVEILIVDDGSTDRTAEMADAYAQKYPAIVKVIHKQNGGHGSAVNAGIAGATGLFFKVVDSDDWVKEESYYEILQALSRLICFWQTMCMKSRAKSGKKLFPSAMHCRKMKSLHGIRSDILIKHSTF